MPTCCFIELASGVVRAGTVEGYGKKAKLVAFHEERFIASDDDLPRILNSLFETLASRIRLSGQNVTICLSSRLLIFREVTFPFDDKKRIAKTLPFQIEENIPLPLDEVVLDAFEVSKSPIGSVWYACCMQKRLMKALLEACENISIDPSLISPSFVGVPFIQTSDETRLVVDIGHETTNLVVVKGEQLLFMRSLRLAGKTLTASFASSLSLDIPVAEETKHSSRGFDDANSLTREIFTGEINRLVRDLKLTLSSLPTEKTPTSICVIGGGAKINGIDRYLSNKLSLPCSIIEPDTVFGDYKLLVKPQNSGFLSAFGVAAAENAGGTVAINFRTGEFAFHGVFDRIAMSLLVMVILLACLLAVGLLFFHTEHKKVLDAKNAAIERVENCWRVAVPDMPPPKDLSKYGAFIADKLKRVSEEADAFGKYYSRSVLSQLTNLSNILAGVQYDFVNIEIGKTNMKIVLSVDEVDSNMVNDALQRSKSYFKDFSPDIVRKTEGRVDYTVVFSFSDR